MTNDLKNFLEGWKELFKKWREQWNGAATNHYATDDEISNWWIEQIKSSQLYILLYVKGMVNKMVVNTPEQVAELNKHLPSTLQTQSYNRSVGYVDAVSDLQSLLDEEINKVKELINTSIKEIEEKV